jgi:hypothetical protein
MPTWPAAAFALYRRLGCMGRPKRLMGDILRNPESGIRGGFVHSGQAHLRCQDAGVRGSSSSACAIGARWDEDLRTEHGTLPIPYQHRVPCIDRPQARIGGVGTMVARGVMTNHSVANGWRIDHVSLFTTQQDRTQGRSLTHRRHITTIQPPTLILDHGVLIQQSSA